MAAGFWDIVGKAANLLQLLGGLHYAATLITTAASSFLRFYEANEGCRKLEERVRMLRVLLPSPGGCWIMTQPHLDELGHLVTNALNDAHDLVDSYNGSTLFARIRRGRTMATRSRDLPISIDSYCGLILSVNAVLIVVLANPPPPPSLVRTEMMNDGGVTTSTVDSTDAEISTGS